MPDPEATRLAQEWLQWSRDDIRAAEELMRSGEAQPRHACFWAQQAAEKAVKAAFVLEQVEFPYVHDLNALEEALPGGWHVPGNEPELEWLSRWAMEARYPSNAVASPHDAERSFRLAVAIVDEVSTAFKARGAA